MWGHARCESIEQKLLVRISDLEEELRDARRREVELQDRFLAVVNPTALAVSVAARPKTPAAAMPFLPKAPTRRVPITANTTRPTAARPPILSPEETVAPVADEPAS